MLFRLTIPLTIIGFETFDHHASRLCLEMMHQHDGCMMLANEAHVLIDVQINRISGKRRKGQSRDESDFQ